MDTGPHHPSLRKRVYTNLEPYPHPEAKKRFLDRIIFVVGAIGPICTIPQAYTIFAHHTAQGINVFTWTIYVLSSIIWFVYGVVHKEKAIIFTYLLWIIANGIVVIGALIY